MTCHLPLQDSPADDLLPAAAPDAVQERSWHDRTWTHRHTNRTATHRHTDTPTISQHTNTQTHRQTDTAATCGCCYRRWPQWFTSVCSSVCLSAVCPALTCTPSQYWQILYLVNENLLRHCWLLTVFLRVPAT